jgi:hypothetical protein
MIPQESSSRTPGALARVAAEGVRALNHATLGRGGFRWPGDVDNVIGELQVLAERLPQAFSQARGWLADQHDAGRVGHDTEPTATDVTVLDVITHLDLAQADAVALAQSLRGARACSSHLTGVRR